MAVAYKRKTKLTAKDFGLLVLALDILECDYQSDKKVYDSIEKLRHKLAAIEAETLNLPS